MKTTKNGKLPKTKNYLGWKLPGIKMIKNKLSAYMIDE